MAASPSSGSERPPDGLAGRVLAGRYRLERHIASGGMAQVWEATDQTLSRRVAVKILHPHLARDASFVRRFRGEAVAAARLAHPSIVSVYDTVADDGLLAIVMELVSGTTLRADLDQHGPLQLGAVLAIGTQVADALAAAHASGLVHRDVKPANILLSADGRVLVADFGIAKAAEGADLTSDGSMIGTAKYLAPEQVEGGAIDGRTDLYALGVVLYEALTGAPPFTADTDTGTALARLHRDPTPPRHLRAEIPPAVEQVVTRALARRPEDRFADASAMRQALVTAGADPDRAPAAAQAAVAAAHGGSAPGPPPRGPSAVPWVHPPLVPPPPPGPPSQHRQPAPRPTESERPGHRRHWAGLAVVLVAALVGGVVVATTRPGTTAHPIPLADVRSFDPYGPGDGENDGQLGLITDADPSTAWRTERYGSPPDLTVGKGGVGLIAMVSTSVRLDHLDITTPQGGWSAEVYVSDGAPPGDLRGWGTPVAALTDVATGTTDVRLPGRRGRAVLLWFTRLVAVNERQYAAQVAALGLRGT